MISSASSGSSFQTPRQVSGGTRIASCSAQLDHLVAELELQLAGDDEVDLLLRLVPVPIRALAARVLRHATVRERDLLGTDRIRDPPHLAGIVAQPILDLVECTTWYSLNSHLRSTAISNTTAPSTATRADLGSAPGESTPG